MNRARVSSVGSPAVTHVEVPMRLVVAQALSLCLVLGQACTEAQETLKKVSADIGKQA